MSRLDRQRLRRLLPYLGRDRKRLLLTLLLLIPLALAASVQPLLVGQAISKLRGEPVLAWLTPLSVPVALRVLVLLLLGAVLLRLSLQGTQTYNVQVVGQRLTARIRDDLFRHAMALSLRFHDRTPVGKLLTRLTSDVDALAEVFGSGAVGVLADLVTLLVIGLTMLSIEWRLGLLLLLSQVPVTLGVLWLQGRYRKANYRVREELGQLNADLQENLQGLEVVQMFRREAVNSERFSRTTDAYRQGRHRHDLLRQLHLGLHRMGGPGRRRHGPGPGGRHGHRWRHGPGHSHHLHPLLPAGVRPPAPAGGTVHPDPGGADRGGTHRRTAGAADRDRRSAHQPAQCRCASLRFRPVQPRGGGVRERLLRLSPRRSDPHRSVLPHRPWRARGHRGPHRVRARPR